MESDILAWLTGDQWGEFLFTMLVSMIPVVELRGGIPFGVATLGLSYPTAFLAAILGNFLPVPFIIVYIRRIFQFLRRSSPRLDRMVSGLERKAHLKGRKVSRYQYLGLTLFVGIPLPGTGAWSGALVAAFLDMPLRRALPSILLGLCLAGGIMAGLTSLGVDLFVTVLG